MMPCLTDTQTSEIAECLNEILNKSGRAVVAATTANSHPSTEEIEMSLIASAQVYAEVQYLIDILNEYIESSKIEV